MIYQNPRLGLNYNFSAGGNIAEKVIKDIQSGLIEFNDEIVTIDKPAYKEKKADAKKARKKAKKRRKVYLKKKKKREREKKKQERKKKS